MATTAIREKNIQKLGRFWNTYGDYILGYGKVPNYASGVGGNTYRAYGKFVKKTKPRRKENQPSEIFKDWIKEYKRMASDLDSSLPFITLHNTALKSLVKYWNKRTYKHRPLEIYPYATKLLDLHLKHIIWHDRYKTPPGRLGELRDVMYQPLDSYSLALLSECGVALKDGEPIKPNATMGLVKNKNGYIHLQNAIERICGEANVPMFAFDQFAWNHRYATKD